MTANDKMKLCAKLLGLMALVYLSTAATSFGLAEKKEDPNLGSKRTEEPEQQQQQQDGSSELLSSKINVLHTSTRWSGGQLENLSRGSGARDQLNRGQPNENEISDSSSGQPQPPQQQQQYSCGRAYANKRHLGGDFELAASSTRSKYRPFEIRTPRIIGGDETNPGEFPWTVSVKLNGQPICGGSLISRSWILTAAHCVVGYNPKNLTVRLGAYRIKDPSEQQIVDSPISLFIVHKQYSMPRPFSNDIALLKMAEPVEYSDFIIPICLPTEDQISTSLVSEIASDYLPKAFQTTPGAAGAIASGGGGGGGDQPVGSEDFEVSDGIVVSTKMSDKEISKCFKRLEQNYLNSIGLGTSSAPASGVDEPPVAGATPTQSSVSLVMDEINQLVSGTSAEDQQQRQQQKKKNYLMPPMPVELLPITMTNQLQAALNGPFKGDKIHVLSDSNSLLGPMFVTTNNENRPAHVAGPNQNGNKNLYETHTITNNNHKINFPAFSDFNNFEQAQAAANQPLAVINNQHRVNRNHRNNHQQQQQQQHGLHLINNQHQPALEHQLFGGHKPAPWAQRRAAAADADRSQREARQAPAPMYASSEHKAIKLTSLPISKELLREIQSVGSMQSLNLGLQQGDFVAMADDLGAASAPALVSPSGYAAERERVLTTVPSSSSSLSSSEASGHLQGTRQLVRDTESISNELTSAGDAEPTKYSGMTGIVVGWGWVRENDHDGEQSIISGGQRSYQSVTLQKVRLPILRNGDCEAWFRSQEKKITLLPSQFCAGYNLGGKDACRGDSGGPMIIEDNSDTGRYKLIGIVSAGIGCARPSLPGLYTRVASFLPWIHAQMQHY